MDEGGSNTERDSLASTDVPNDITNIRRRIFLSALGAVGGASFLGSSTVARAQQSTLRGTITEFEAEPDSGFNYPYYLFVPDTTPDHPRPILIDPTNNPSATDDFSKVREYGRKVARGGISRRMSEELAVPLLVPMFPRPKTEPVDWHHEIQMLDAETMHISTGPLERVDLQLIQMIQHASDQLDDVSFPVTGSVLLNGFSASGNFVNRFTALHPDIVDGVTAGGVNGTPLLPHTELEGQSLPYPIGIADFEEVADKTFQRSTWEAVDQLIYMGGEDENDTIPYDDVWNDTLREIALEVYGEDMQEDRMPFSENIYAEAGANAQVVVYPNTGHGYQPKLRSRLVDFHRKHSGDWHASFVTPPVGGANTATVAAGVPEDVNGDEFDVAIQSSEKGIIGNGSEVLGPGDSRRMEIDLSSAVEIGEPLTVGIRPKDGSFSQAKTTTSQKVVGKLEFVDVPAGGESVVKVSYALDADYHPSSTPKLRVDTQSGGSVVLSTLQPGEEDTLTADLENANGIPFMAERDVSLVIVEGDPAGADPIAERTIQVPNPDTPAASVDISTDEVVERGKIANVAIEVQGLGGEITDGELTVLVNGEEETNESFTVARAETTTVETGIRTDGYSTQQLTVEAKFGESAATSSIIVAEMPKAGIGTREDPYQITTPAELAYIPFELGSAYKLESSLDLSEFDTFPIIGTMKDQFTGYFDGDYHEIRNLTIEKENDTFDGVGLFGNIFEATIKRVGLSEVDISGEEFVGGLVGVATQTGTITQVRVSGSVSGETNVAGLIGGTTTRKADSSNVEISQIGTNVDVQGSRKVGGIAGQPSGDTIRNAYATGSIAAESGGGLIGGSFFGTTLALSFAANFIASSRGDPVIGKTDKPNVEAVYWDKDATGRATSSVSGATGLSGEEIKGTAAKETLTGYDFDEIWETGSSESEYPVFSWEAELDPAPQNTTTGDPTTTESTTTTTAGSSTTSTTTESPTESSTTESSTTESSTTESTTESTTATTSPGFEIISTVGGLASALGLRKWIGEDKNQD